MKFDIVEVFTRAAKITWKFKVLWIFGILASCGRGGGNNSNSSSDGSENGVNPLSPEMQRQFEEFSNRFVNWFEQNPWILYAMIAFVLVALVVQIVFSLVGTAGLARGVFHAENGAESLEFGELLSESFRYFWRLFGAGLVIWLPVFVLIFGSFFALLYSMDGMTDEVAMGSGLVIFFISLCCCMLPVSIALTLYHTQVIRAITVEDNGVFSALARGWQIFSGNFLAFLLIGVILFIGSFILQLIISLPIFLLVLPLMAAFVQGNITSWQPFLAVGVFILCYSPIAWFLSGVLITYTETVWTLAYVRITQPKEETPVLSEANA